MAPRKTISAEGPKVGESEKQRKFLVLAKNRFGRAEAGQEEWRRQAVEYYKTYGGHPWPDGVKEAMEEIGKPATNFNFALSQVNAILGQDISDRKEPRYLAEYEAAAQFGAEAITRVVRKLYNKAKAQREETDSYQDQLVTGYGWSETILDTFAFPVLPKPGMVDAREMYWDPDAKKSNLRDRRYQFRRRKWYLEDAIAAFPEAEEKLRAASIGGEKKGEGSAIGTKKANATGFRDRDRVAPSNPLLDEEHVFLYDYQYVEPVRYVAFTDPTTGKDQKVQAKDFKALEKGFLDMTAEPPGDGSPPAPLFESIESVPIILKRVHRATLVSDAQGEMAVVQEPEELETGKFAIDCATGFRSKLPDGAVGFFGLMALIYEPQLWIAKAMSSALEHVARSPKGGGGFYNPQFLENPDQFIEQGSQSGKWHAVKNGFDPKLHIFKLDQPQFPQAYEKLFDILVTVLPQLTTISDYFKGTAQQERSNVLVTNLQGQTLLVLNVLLDPMNELRVQNATNMALLVQQHMSRDVFNRLCGPMEMEDVTFVYQRDPTTGAIMRGMDGKEVKIQLPVDPSAPPQLDPATGQPIVDPVTPYDIVAELDLDNVDVQIELGPASATQRNAIWTAWNQTAMGQKMMELYPQAAALIAPMLIKNTPGLPAEEGKQLEKELRDMIDKQLDAGSVEMIVKSLQELPPDQVQQILGFGQQVLMAHAQNQQAQGNPAAAANQPPVR